MLAIWFWIWFWIDMNVIMTLDTKRHWYKISTAISSKLNNRDLPWYLFLHWWTMNSCNFDICQNHTRLVSRCHRVLKLYHAPFYRSKMRYSTYKFDFDWHFHPFSNRHRLFQCRLISLLFVPNNNNKKKSIISLQEKKRVCSKKKFQI